MARRVTGKTVRVDCAQNYDRTARQRMSLLHTRCSAPSAGHQIDIRPRLEERIGRGIDAVHSRDGIKDDVLLLAGVVRSNLRQTDLAERELRSSLWPADS